MRRDETDDTSDDDGGRRARKVDPYGVTRDALSRASTGTAHRARTRAREGRRRAI